MFSLILMPFRAIKWLVKLAGIRGFLLLLIGVGVGMLVAPERGTLMRARLRARIEEARGGTVSELVDPVV